MVVVLLRNGTKRTLDLVDLEDDESEVLPSIRLRVKGASGYLLPCDMVVHRNPHDVFQTALVVLHDKRVWVSEGSRLKTG